MDWYNAACAWTQMQELEEAVALLKTCLPKMPSEFIDWVKQDVDLVSLHIVERFRNLLASGEAQLAGSSMRH
jgi:hypothetical protein